MRHGRDINGGGILPFLLFTLKNVATMRLNCLEIVTFVKTQYSNSAQIVP